MANPTSGARNPGFDVTPAELITGIITPAGIFKPKELWANGANWVMSRLNLPRKRIEISFYFWSGGVAKW